ncbi:GNAT family N-acetyltransferase [Vibrio rhodolitus]|uniref:GNAT family N-acetyltransferase n=1 Tax=Vibrio rhodolitus TaxID=2231649 RepID=UPI000E0A5DC1|nr:GNAT family N-acetyltransferase [Vibrio rhodolitus]
MKITIRRATTEDAEQISSLIVPLTKKFVCPTWDESVHHIVLNSMSADKIAEYLTSNYYYLVAENQYKQVVAAGSVRDYSHLYHLFVKEDHQGQGLSTQLWHQLKAISLQNGNSGTFTVNSALNAEQVYARFGFKRTQGVRNHKGMVDVPMQLIVGE